MERISRAHQLILMRMRFSFEEQDLMRKIVERKIPMKSVLCLSGGLDSTTAYFWLKYVSPNDELKSVYVNLNTKYSQKETDVVTSLNAKISGLDIQFCTGPDMSSFDADKTGYVRFRNLYLAMLAAQFGTNIRIIGVKGDKVCDKSPEAFETMSTLLNAVSDIDRDGPVTISSPFWDLTKTDLVKFLLENLGKEKAIDVLKTSSSCYDSIKTHCGHCPSCFRKWIALEAAGIESVSWFTSDPRKYDEIPNYISRLKNGKYEAQRTAETVLILAKYGLLNLEGPAQVREKE